MDGLSKCPRCGYDELEYREVEEVVVVGNDAGIVRVDAYACLRCGEKVFSAEMAERLEKARELLEPKPNDLEVIGRVFKLRVL